VYSVGTANWIHLKVYGAVLVAELIACLACVTAVSLTFVCALIAHKSATVYKCFHCQYGAFYKKSET
jgi:hypothetical protein